MNLFELFQKYGVTDEEIAEAMYAWLAQQNEEKEFMEDLVKFLSI